MKLILVFAKGDAFGGVLHTIKRKELPTELITNRQWEYADYTVLLDVSFADLDFLGGGCSALSLPIYCIYF